MKPLHISTFSLHGFLKILFYALLIGFIVWYGHFQARFFIEGPKLTLTSPTVEVSNERIISVTGSTENITDITLNGRSIHTDAFGNFTESLVLENGYTIMTVEVRDRYGRTSSLSRGLVYEPGV